MNVIFDFVNKYLPTYLHNNDNLGTILFEADDLNIEKIINSAWNEYYSSRNISSPPLIECHTRNVRSKYSKNLEKMILIKYNADNNSEESYVTSIIYTNEHNTLKYFMLSEINSRILPQSYLKNNEKYLLTEINRENFITNWGKILNPRNFSDITNSISLVTQ